MRLAARPPEPVTLDQKVRRAAFLARAHRGHAVSVAGPDGLEAAIALCRAGFDQVACARQAIGAAEASDVLLFAGPMTRGELADTIARTGRLLRSGGAFVAQLAHPADDAVIRAALAVQGLAIAASRFDVAAGWLVAHRVERQTPRFDPRR